MMTLQNLKTLNPYPYLGISTLRFMKKKHKILPRSSGLEA